ncbi:lysozyme [Odontomachus brunneus]|uniref:lysozyme n=1 Tax=Odontomachus brunneus TaxID=486640 RepID=UPI0013F18C6A|nr:lysozyme [Odontomachus brunneus]
MGNLWVILLISIITITHLPVEGKVMAQCDVVRELMRAKISRSFISNWICLMQSESGLDTRVVKGPKTASSYSYGIFQINSVKWCTRGRAGGLCNARCEDFANDDIQDDITCAKKIYNRDGFKAWDGWMKNCKNKPLPNIGNCRRRRMTL